MVIELSRDRYR